jgi:hypothetical protein
VSESVQHVCNMLITNETNVIAWSAMMRHADYLVLLETKPSSVVYRNARPITPTVVIDYCQLLRFAHTSTSFPASQCVLSGIHQSRYGLSH